MESDEVRLVYLLQQSASESELLELLCALTVPKLKVQCNENGTNFREQGQCYQMISYIMEGSM